MQCLTQNCDDFAFSIIFIIVFCFLPSCHSLWLNNIPHVVSYDIMHCLTTCWRLSTCAYDCPMTVFLVLMTLLWLPYDCLKTFFILWWLSWAFWHLLMTWLWISNDLLKCNAEEYENKDHENNAITCWTWKSNDFKRIKTSSVKRNNMKNEEHENDAQCDEIEDQS